MKTPNTVLCVMAKSEKGVRYNSPEWQTLDLLCPVWEIVQMHNSMLFFELYHRWALFPCYFPRGDAHKALTYFIEIKDSTSPKLMKQACCDIKARLNTSKNTSNFWLKMIVFGHFRAFYRHLRTVKNFY
jgi:hypothetical protein